MGATLSAGLWPFSFHKSNEVHWKPEAAGLFFGTTGMVVSRDKFQAADQNHGCSFEVWIEPGQTWGTGTILSFYESGVPPRIQVRQSGDDLLFSASRPAESGKARQQEIFLEHIFRKGQPVFIALASADNSLDFYIDGELRKSVSNVAMQTTDFTGTLLVANAYNENVSWTGIFRGLALYDRALRPSEIAEDHRLWQHDKARMAQNTVRAYALYLFDEPAGDRVRNLGNTGPDLVIPKNYSVFEPGFLVPFWKEYRPSWHYARDLAINVFGLVPVGCCFAALLAWLNGRRRSLLYATLLGLLTSMTIEVLQAFMPTRFSGMTDLISNTLGAALGAWLYLNPASQGWLRRTGLVRTREAPARTTGPEKVLSQP